MTSSLIGFRKEVTKKKHGTENAKEENDKNSFRCRVVHCFCVFFFHFTFALSLCLSVFRSAFCTCARFLCLLSLIEKIDNKIRSKFFVENFK